MSLGPCRTALLASLAKGFGFSANLNSSLSSVSHMQDKESCILLSEPQQCPALGSRAPCRQGHPVLCFEQGWLSGAPGAGTEPEGTVPEEGLALVLGCTPTASAALVMQMQFLLQAVIPWSISALTGAELGTLGMVLAGLGETQQPFPAEFQGHFPQGLMGERKISLLTVSPVHLTRIGYFGGVNVSLGSGREFYPHSALGV